jgi:hypothetical protein
MKQLNLAKPTRDFNGARRFGGGVTAVGSHRMAAVGPYGRSQMLSHGVFMGSALSRFATVKMTVWKL